MKTCSKCSKTLDESCFNTVKRKGMLHLKAACKKCQSAYEKQRRLENLEYAREKQYKWFQQNKDKHYQTVKTYQEANKQYLKDKRKQRLLRDVNHRIARNLRCRLWCALNKSKDNFSAVKDLGCSIEELKNHLASMFKDGMSWENYGAWQIDHIVPLSNFDLTCHDQLLKACHYTNLQPMWSSENASKRNRYSGQYRTRIIAAEAEKE
jgi:hypothetical protein